MGRLGLKDNPVFEMLAFRVPLIKNNHKIVWEQMNWENPAGMLLLFDLATAVVTQIIIWILKN